MDFVYTFSSFSKRACESEIPTFSTKELVDNGGGASDLYIRVVMLSSSRFPKIKGNPNFDDLIDEPLVSVHTKCAIERRHRMSKVALYGDQSL